MSALLNWAYGFDRLNLYLTLSIHIALMMALLYPFRKRLARAVSPGQIVTLLTAVMTIYLFFPSLWGLLDAREWYALLGLRPKSLFHFSLPVRIPSQIAEIPSVGRWEWLYPCTLVWVAGYMILAILYTWRIVHFRRQIKKRLQPCHITLHIRMARILHELDPGYTKKIGLATAEGLTSPCVIYGNPPIIVLSQTDLSDEALDLILRHELIHILSKHERLIGGMDCLHILCWFNPTLILLRKWCECQAELDADEKVLRRKASQRKTYARLLVELAEAHPGTQAAALRLSAAAAYIRDRVDAVLNPRGHRCSVPILILLVIFFVHMTLLVAPGGTLEKRFPDKVEMLACLGNPVETNVRGLDSLSDSTVWYFHENKNLANLYMSMDYYGTVRSLWAFLTPANENEKAVVQSYLADWQNSLNDLLGEPMAVRNQGIPFFGAPQETLFWPVTVTPLARERLKLTSHQPTLLSMQIIPYDDAYEMIISLTQEEP